jgi:hypothetical protein
MLAGGGGRATAVSPGYISPVPSESCDVSCFSFSIIIGFKTSCGRSTYTNRTEEICPIQEGWYIQLFVSVWTLC